MDFLTIIILMINWGIFAAVGIIIYMVLKSALKKIIKESLQEFEIKNRHDMIMRRVTETRNKYL